MTTMVLSHLLLLMMLLGISGCKQEVAQQTSPTASDAVTGTEPKKANTALELQTPTEAVASVTVVYATTPLDLTAAQLPSHYEGHDPEEFYRNASAVRKLYEKGEFESTKQFKERVASLQHSPFIKTLNNDSEFAFRVVPKYREYNADSQELRLSFDVESCVYELEKYDTGKYPSYCHVDVLKLKSAKDKPEFYEASNALGAKVEVTRTSEEVLGIILGDALPRPKEVKDLDYPGLKLRIPPEEAKKVKDTINLLVILKPQAPLTEYVLKSNTPTMNIPLQRFVRLRLIVGRVVGVWLYNYETGEVYKKYKLRA